MLNEYKRSHSVQAVEKALAVLEAVCETNGGVHLSDLSQNLGIKKTSVWRLLSTFTQKGYIEKEESGKYRLGLTAYAMGIRLRLRMELLNKAKPVMYHLARECNEAVYVAVPHNESFFLLDMVDTGQAVRTIPLIGNAYSLDQTAVGKVIRAFSMDDGGGTDADDCPSLNQESALIRQQGACVEYGGFGDGTACVAVPLFNVHGKVCGSLCLIGPEFRFLQERVKWELIPLLKEGGQVVSATMGCLY